MTHYIDPLSGAEIICRVRSPTPVVDRYARTGIGASRYANTTAMGITAQEMRKY
ncbi:MAG: hypothetical protein AAFY26_15215 [Cyanobacteria bacterium J06638_22]